MNIARFLAICALVLIALGAQAEQVTLMRTVLLPDGRPAVGASVLVRSYDQAGKIAKETPLTTDAQGQFSLVLDASMEALRDNPTMTDYRDGYFIVDMPGYALHFELYRLLSEKVLAQAGAPGNAYRTTHLADNYDTTGRVTSIPHSVENAFVGVIKLTNGTPKSPTIPLNMPAFQASTPALTAKTGPTGVYHLRGITASFSNDDNVNNRVIPVRAALAVLSGDDKYVAETDNGIFAPPALTTPGKSVRNDMTLYPTVSVEGRVTNAATGEPVAGVKVMLQARPGNLISCLPPAITDKDGRYQFFGIPTYVKKMFAQCSVDGMAGGWTKAFESRGPMGPLTDINMQVRPWVDIKGTMIDIATKQKPLTPVVINALYDVGTDDTEIQFRSLGQQSIACPVNDDGSFVLHVPAGASILTIDAAGYGGYERVNANLKDNPPLTFTVNRQLGIVIHFASNRPIDWRSCYVLSRYDNGNSSSHGSLVSILGDGLINFKPQWGMKNLQICLMQDRTVIFPWTPVTGDPNTWVFEYRIP